MQSSRMRTARSLTASHNICTGGVPGSVCVLGVCMSPGGHVCLGACMVGGCTCLGACMSGDVCAQGVCIPGEWVCVSHAQPSTGNRILDNTCENITFPQLLFRAVNMDENDRFLKKLVKN